MGIPILSVRDDQGNIIPIPAIQGRDGVDGKDGKDGAAGPNLINQNTLTPLSGILMGSGGSVKTAVSGTDYATPAAVDTKLDADDYTRTINTATTTGAAGSFALTLDPAPAALAQGMMLLVNFHVGNDSTTTPPLLNVNGLGGKYLMPAGVGSARPFKAGLHVIFYDGTNWRMLDNAFLSVNGGAVYGNIVPSGALSYNLGASGVPWYHIYAINGNFSNTLAVDGNSVWHKGNLKIASGTFTCIPDRANAVKNTTIDISSYGFTAVPAVFANACSAWPNDCHANAHSMTKTSFVASGVRESGTDAFSVTWLAIGI